MWQDFHTDGPIFAAIRVVGGPLSARDVLAVKGAIAEARAQRSDTPLFDVARELDDDEQGLSQAEVDLINTGLSAARKKQASLPAVPRGRTIGTDGLALLKRWEGLRLKAYLCPARVWTIGYGSTGPHVQEGMVITEADADALLQRDLDRFEDAVAKAAPSASEGQFDAMVCLAFNIGIGAFLKSTLLKLHQHGEFSAASMQFVRWNKARGKELPGLTRRRQAEAQLYRRQP